MTKEDKIHIKLEICRDEQSHGLTIMTHFDESAPNFFKDKEGYFWIPTVEEKDFLNEAFEIAPSSGMKMAPEKPVATPPEKKEETPALEPVVDKKEEVPTPEPIVDEKEEILLPEEPAKEKVEEKPEELPLSPFENKETKKHIEMPPLEQTEKEEVFEVAREEPAHPYTDNATKEEDKGVIVEADDDAIEKALKKRQAKENDSTIVTVDEKTIVEKVLSQKKKGKWGRVNQ